MDFFDDTCLACDSYNININIDEDGSVYYECLDCDYAWDDGDELDQDWWDNEGSTL